MNVHIACAVDNVYVQHCAVMLTSLFENNKSIDFNVVMLSEGISKDNLEKLKYTFKKYNQNLELKLIDNTSLEKAPISHHISVSTYYRLLLPNYVSEEIDKILYLDSDIIVRSSIKELWQVDITDKFHAASCEDTTIEHKRQIGLFEDALYFNAGVLLINLKKWREMNFSQQAITHLNLNFDKLKYWDQDVLNSITGEDFVFLHPKWNATESIFKEKTWRYIISCEELRQIKKDPNIVHFTGGGNNKPWFYECVHPFKREYYYYLGKTKWLGFVPVGNPNFIRRMNSMIVIVKNSVGSLIKKTKQVLFK